MRKTREALTTIAHAMVYCGKERSKWITGSGPGSFEAKAWTDAMLILARLGHRFKAQSYREFFAQESGFPLPEHLAFHEPHKLIHQSDESRRVVIPSASVTLRADNIERLENLKAQLEKLGEREDNPSELHKVKNEIARLDGQLQIPERVIEVNLAEATKGICAYCSKPLGQELLPFVPKIPKTQTDTYHLECRAESLRKSDLKKNPKIEIKVTLSLSEILDLLSSAKLNLIARETLYNAAVNTGQIIKCEHCKIPVYRELAVSGEITRSVEYPQLKNPSVVDHRVKTIRMFCCVQHDRTFADKRVLEIARENEERAKARAIAAENAEKVAKVKAEKKAPGENSLEGILLKMAKDNPSQFSDLMAMIEKNKKEAVEKKENTDEKK